MTQTLKAAGGLAAATLALALLISCASRPLATPTAPIVVPTPTPMPAPASPESGAGRVLPPRRPPSPAARRPPASPEPGAGRVLLTAADGYIADGEGLSPFATDYPAVGNLAPELLAAVQRASTDAVRDGVHLMITSGWRSVRYQQSLLDAAVAHYGSGAEARRWVNTPEKSTHVTGRAVDIGPTAAALWLRQRGNRYGLCQIYANEMWHYELATERGGTCPRPIADASAG
jgi:zinc D-Ala-D-Ala carboxypeptidase